MRFRAVVASALVLGITSVADAASITTHPVWVTSGTGVALICMATNVSKSTREVTFRLVDDNHRVVVQTHEESLEPGEWTYIVESLPVPGTEIRRCELTYNGSKDGIRGVMQYVYPSHVVVIEAR